MNNNKKIRKTALITGIGSQDGAYLGQLLLSKGYTVFGTSRDANVSHFDSLKRLGIFDRVNLLSMVPSDFRSTLMTLSRVQPDEIYHLAGQTSVALSFDQPAEAIDSIVIGSLNILESMRFLSMPCRFYHASSSECFGDTAGRPADELTPFNPVSPYGVAKCAAHWLVRSYREGYKLYAVNGILFNHESELRPTRFVTQKIVTTAHRISMGSTEKLILGDTTMARDWGWAPEFVKAIWMILQADMPDDFVIATGETNCLEDFVAQSFAFFGLDWKDHVQHDITLKRPNEIIWSQGNSDKACRILGWRARHKMSDVVKILCRSQLNLSAT